MKKKTKWIMIAAGAIMLGSFCHYQNKHLTISYYTCENQKIPSQFDGYRIVQISDLHNASFGRENRKLLEKIRQLRPDMIAITGDIVDSKFTDVDVATAFVREAVKICPVYYATGNHEDWLADEDMIRQFETDGANVMSDRFVKIDRDGASIVLVGIKNEHLYGQTLENIMMQTDEKDFSLLLAHEPQLIQKYSKAGVDLTLSGHAHGGQFRLPFLGGVYAPGQGFWPKYVEGKYQSDDMTMIVSRGIGNSIIRLRLFNYPEIVCVDLRVGTTVAK